MENRVVGESVKGEKDDCTAPSLAEGKGTGGGRQEPYATVWKDGKEYHLY